MQFQVIPISSVIIEDALRRLAGGDPSVEERIIQGPTGAPCRLTLEESHPGERVLLFRHRPFEADSPYTEEGPIFARLDQQPARLAPGELPPFMQHRKLLVVKRYDAANAIAGAEIVKPEACADAISRALDDPQTAYVHVRNAGYGCFLFRADRAA